MGVKRRGVNTYLVDEAAKKKAHAKLAAKQGFWTKMKSKIGLDAKCDKDTTWHRTWARIVRIRKKKSKNYNTVKGWILWRDVDDSPFFELVSPGHDGLVDKKRAQEQLDSVDLNAVKKQRAEQAANNDKSLGSLANNVPALKGSTGKKAIDNDNDHDQNEVMSKPSAVHYNLVKMIGDISGETSVPKTCADRGGRGIVVGGEDVDDGAKKGASAKQKRPSLLLL